MTLSRISMLIQTARMLLASLCLTFSVTAHAQSFDFAGGDEWLAEEEEFLPVDEAFVLTATLNANGVISANWQMPDGYYLYRHQFGIESRSQDLVLGEANIPPGKQKVDEYFGEVEVYYHEAQMAAPMAPFLSTLGQFPLAVTLAGAGMESQSTVMSPGTPERTGTTVLSTVATRIASAM